MTFYIRYGLGGGFGGAGDWEKIEASSLEKAENIAYQNACEEYEAHYGICGIRSVDEIMEEDTEDIFEAELNYFNERESWLVYEVCSSLEGTKLVYTK